MFIELEEEEYQCKPRTAIVVYNGNDGKRSAPAKFEKIKKEIESKANEEGILSRTIERWDLSYFSKILFPYRKELLEKENFVNSINAMMESINIIDSIKKTFRV